MWITVEKTLKSGDYLLGISKLKIKGSLVSNVFPHRSTQVINTSKSKIIGFTSKNFCNYKVVILLTHFLTLVTTTNFKYKYHSLNELFTPQIEVAL